MAELYADPTNQTGADNGKLDAYQPTEDEKAQVKRWLDRIKRAEDEPKRKQWVEDLVSMRGYVDGTRHKDSNNAKLTRTNLVFATIAALMPHLYAKDPDIGVTPSPACPNDKLPAVKKFCTTAEAVLSQMFIKEAKLKRRMKANMRAAMTTSYGVVKMIYQKSLHGDPLVIRRIQDTQDNLARVESLIRDMKDQSDPTTLATQRDELRGQLEGLRSQNEVKVFKGFVIDRLRSEDFLLLDDSIAEFDEYVDAAALGHMVWMTADDFETKFGFAPSGATKYNTPFAKTEGTQSAEQGLGDMYVCVVEVWDKSSGSIRTVAKGMQRWARQPYAPENMPARWYPFYVLGFNLVEGRWRPISDVELLTTLQDEYNTTRTNFADTRERSFPITLFRKGGTQTEEDIKAVINAKAGDYIGVEGSPTTPISQDYMQLPGPKIDPQAYDVSLIRNDIDMMAGLSDASRANLIKAKTATEAQIMQDSLGLRVDERRDTNEDLISEMAEAALEIALRDLSKAEVQQIAGDATEWPEMSVEQIFSMVNVSVRAGSSGKPNADKDREQWTKLLPVIQQTMQTVMELRQSGQYDMADATVELLRETLRRFQERIDVDSIIPPLEKGPDGKPAAQAQAAQQVMQLQQQMQEIQQQLADCQQQLQKAQMAEQAKVAQVQADANLQAQKQTAEDERRKADIASKESIQQADIAARERAAALQTESDEKIALAKDASAQATAITVARIGAGRDSPEEETAAQESAANVAAEQAEALRQEREASDARFQQTHQAILDMGQKLQDGLTNMAQAANGEREIVTDPTTGMPVGMRPKRLQ